MTRLTVGVDIGGTKTHAVVVDASGRILEQLRLPTGFGSTEVVASAAAAVTQLAERLGIPTGAFSSIGVGIPGSVDTDRGRVAHAVNLGLEDLDLEHRLSVQLGGPVRLENDVNAAALGAHRLLGDGVQSLAYLNLGTGLAAGFVLRGELWRGARGNAGEIGHIPVDPNGLLCPCGQRGCLETVASGSAVARQWPTDHPLPVLALFEAAERGEPAAIEVRDRLIVNVAAAVRLLVLTVDVDTVMIGGGISALGYPLISRVRASLDEWALQSPFIASLGLAERVQLVPPGFPAAAVGAALVGERA